MRDKPPVSSAASSSSDRASAAGTSRRWTARRLLGLLQRLAGLAMDIRAAATERAEREAAKIAAGDGGNVDPDYADPIAVDFRLGMIVHRLIGLMARIQMRAASARGAARANASGAVAKRQAAARERAEVKAAFVKETKLDSRYLLLKRPFGQSAPPRRSKKWRYLEGLASVIEGSDDRTVVREACAELAAEARKLGAHRQAEVIELVGKVILAQMDRAPVPAEPGSQRRHWDTAEGAEPAAHDSG